MRYLMNVGRLVGNVKSARCSVVTRSYAAERPSTDLLESATIRPELLVGQISSEFDVIRKFNPEPLIDMQKMFNAGVWHGHKVGTLKDNMKWAVYGHRLETCIFDLNITQEYMRRALMFLVAASYKSSIVLFVTSNRDVMQMVETKAVEIGEYSHTRPWEQGTLTNIKQLFDAPLRLPDVVVFLTTLSSTMTQHPAIIEAAKMTIPTIGIVDTNCEPNYITYPIPGSDDSVRTNEFYMDAFCQAIKFGKEAREQQDKESNKKASNK